LAVKAQVFGIEVSMEKYYKKEGNGKDFSPLKLRSL